MKCMLFTGNPRGSSPLARGLLPVGARERDDIRIIPARAGFTTTASSSPSGRPDHPRSRGVYAGNLQATIVGGGSSPLARGLLRRRDSDTGNLRIIPARAGFTERDLRGARRDVGSSPLARGLPRGGIPDSRRARIIPARAGFTWTGGRDSPSRKDHPRSRGVYVWRTRAPKSSEGSSPLARGLPTSRSSAVYSPRIIPARAGFTMISAPRLSRPMDHPRSRGVYACRT